MQYFFWPSARLLVLTISPWILDAFIRSVILAGWNSGCFGAQTFDCMQSWEARPVRGEERRGRGRGRGRGGGGAPGQTKMRSDSPRGTQWPDTNTGLSAHLNPYQSQPCDVWSTFCHTQTDRHTHTHTHTHSAHLSLYPSLKHTHTQM